MLTKALDALTRALFDKGFKWYLRQGGATIRYPDGSERHYGPEPGGSLICYQSWADLRRVAINPSLGFGDAYTAGRITHLTHDDLVDFLRVVAANRRTGPWARALHRLRWRPPNGRRQQGRNIGEHYDDGGEAMAAWYRDVLGRTLLYTCARFPTWTEALDEAQVVKAHDIGFKLGLSEPATNDEWADNSQIRLLEIGCGWGYIACELARKFGVRVLGITIAREQLPVAKKMAKDMGVKHLVEFRLVSYQQLGEEARDPSFPRFDGAYSIGMFEHVPHSEYNKYFRIVRQLLKPHAPFMFHAIANQYGGLPDPFIARRIFPGSRLGSIDQITRAAAKSQFLFTGGVNIWEYYVLTLQAWLANHLEHREEITRRSGLEFERQRYFWMSASEAAFADGDLSLLQIVFTSGKPRFGS